MRKPTVMILCGGPSRESEISLRSAASVRRALSPDLYEVFFVQISGRGEWRLITDAGDSYTSQKTIIPMRGKVLVPDSGQTIYPDVIFPVIHGDYGEDGTLAGMLDCLCLPYIGCGCTSSAICYDKSICKSVIRNAGIDTLDWCDVKIKCRADTESQILKIEESLPYPLFIKPRRSGSSIGASPAHDRNELTKALAVASAVSCDIMAEPLTKGKECEVAVFSDGTETIVSRPGEVEYGAAFYDFNAKYVSSSSKLYIPARVPPECAEQMRRASRIAFDALECRHLCRFDFFVTDDCRVLLSEANTLPGMTDRSLYPALMEDSNIPFEQLVHRLINDVMS